MKYKNKNKYIKKIKIKILGRDRGDPKLKTKKRFVEREN